MGTPAVRGMLSTLYLRCLACDHQTHVSRALNVLLNAKGKRSCTFDFHLCYYKFRAMAVLDSSGQEEASQTLVPFPIFCSKVLQQRPGGSEAEAAKHHPQGRKR